MILDSLLDVLRGKAITIPPLDGAFRANTALDDARSFAAIPDVDNLVVAGGRLFATSGPDILALEEEAAATRISRCAAPVSALAAAPSGTMAVGLDNGVLQIGGQDVQLPSEIGCITALCFDEEGTLWLANGSARHPPSRWAADLMGKGCSGSLWRTGPDGKSWRRIAAGLAFPYGLMPFPGGVLVSESWRHRLIRIQATGSSAPVLSKLPAYPARLERAADGGAWLALFAPRNRLVEFVLEESAYRHAMLDQVAPQFWIAPSLTSNTSFLEPLQCGGIRTMGFHKPWSPSRSYGLVARLDRELQPQLSLHSRADGSRHGVCSVVEYEGRLFAASRGGGCVLALDVAEGEFR